MGRRFARATREERCKELGSEKLTRELLGDTGRNLFSAIGTIQIPGFKQGADLASALFGEVTSITKYRQEKEFIKLGCSKLPFEKLERFIGGRFNRTDRALDRNFDGINTNLQAIRANYEVMKGIDDKVDHTLVSVTNGFSAVARSFGETQMDIKEGFEKLRELVRKTRVEDDTSGLITFIEYFLGKRSELEHLSPEERVRRLAGDDGLLKYFKTSTTTHSATTLHTLLSSIINRRFAIPENADDDTAFSALYLMSLGTETYVDVVEFLVGGYQYLASDGRDRGDVEAFNRNVTQSEDIAREFAYSLNGEAGVITKVINTMKIVKEQEFVRHARPEVIDFVSNKLIDFPMLQSKIDAMKEPTSKPTQRIRFDFTKSAIQTPFLEWRNSTHVSYALQHYIDGSYSKVSDWSTTYTVTDVACPQLNIGSAPAGTIRFIYRKFDHENPKKVGTVTNHTQTTFRDVHRDLYDAAKEANANLAKRNVDILVSNGADVSAKFDQGKQAIHEATLNANKQLTKTFLEKGAGIDARDGRGFTSLHTATQSGDEDFVKFLIAQGADVNANSVRNWTALHVASEKGHENILKTLLRVEKVEVNARAVGGFTPMHFSTRKKISLEVFLSDSRTDVNAQSDAGLTGLHLAVLNGDQAAVASLLSSGKCNVDLKTEGGLTALHLAATAGNKDITQQLLQHNSTSVNAISNEGWSALHLAILLKQKLITDVLLNDTRINVNLEGRGKMTPLHLAGFTTQADTVVDLINHGAELEKRDSHSYTPLLCAAERADAKLVRLLVDKGADINAKEEHGDGPLQIAVRRHKLDTIGYLLDKSARDLDLMLSLGIQTVLSLAIQVGNVDTVMYLSDKNVEGERGRTPLMVAVVLEKPEMVKKILERGVNVDERDYNRNTALHLAVKTGNLAIVQSLSKKIFDFNIKGEEDKAPLQIAVESGYLDIVKFLVERGADVNLKGPFNRTPLFFAAEKGFLEIVKYLVIKGATLGTEDLDGNRPLYFAIMSGALNIVEYLVENGASISEVTNSGQNALHVAAAQKNENIVRYFVFKGLNVNSKDSYERTPLFNAAKRGVFENVKYLVESGAAVDAKDYAGDSPLFMAILSGELTVVKYFVYKGASLNQQNRLGEKVVHFAVKGNNIDILKYLVEKGCDVKWMDSNGRVPLHYAAINNNIEFVKYLVEKGTNVNEGIDSRTTALSYAIGHLNLDMAKFLRSKGAQIVSTDYRDIPNMRYARGCYTDFIQFLEKGADPADHTVCHIYRCKNQPLPDRCNDTHRPRRSILREAQIADGSTSTQTGYPSFPLYETIPLFKMVFYLLGRRSLVDAMNKAEKLSDPLPEDEIKRAEMYLQQGIARYGQ